MIRPDVVAVALLAASASLNVAPVEAARLPIVESAPVARQVLSADNRPLIQRDEARDRPEVNKRLMGIFSDFGNALGLSPSASAAISSIVAAAASTDAPSQSSQASLAKDKGSSKGSSDSSKSKDSSSDNPDAIASAVTQAGTSSPTVSNQSGVETVTDGGSGGSSSAAKATSTGSSKGSSDGGKKKKSSSDADKNNVAAAASATAANSTSAPQSTTASSSDGESADDDDDDDEECDDEEEDGSESDDHDASSSASAASASATKAATAKADSKKKGSAGSDSASATWTWVAGALGCPDGQKPHGTAHLCTATSFAAGKPNTSTAPAAAAASGASSGASSAASPSASAAGASKVANAAASGASNSMAAAANASGSAPSGSMASSGASAASPSSTTTGKSKKKKACKSSKSKKAKATTTSASAAASADAINSAATSPTANKSSGASSAATNSASGSQSSATAAAQAASESGSGSSAHTTLSASGSTASLSPAATSASVQGGGSSNSPTLDVPRISIPKITNQDDNGSDNSRVMMPMRRDADRGHSHLVKSLKATIKGMKNVGKGLRKLRTNKGRPASKPNRWFSAQDLQTLRLTSQAFKALHLKNVAAAAAEAAHHQVQAHDGAGATSHIATAPAQHQLASHAPSTAASTWRFPITRANEHALLAPLTVCLFLSMFLVPAGVLFAVRRTPSTQRYVAVLSSLLALSFLALYALRNTLVSLGALEGVERGMAFELVGSDLVAVPPGDAHVGHLQHKVIIGRDRVEFAWTYFFVGLMQLSMGLAIRYGYGAGAQCDQGGALRGAGAGPRFAWARYDAQERFVVPVVDEKVPLRDDDAEEQ